MAAFELKTVAAYMGYVGYIWSGPNIQGLQVPFL